MTQIVQMKIKTILFVWAGRNLLIFANQLTAEIYSKFITILHNWKSLTKTTNKFKLIQFIVIQSRAINFCKKFRTSCNNSISLRTLSLNGLSLMTVKLREIKSIEKQVIKSSKKLQVKKKLEYKPMLSSTSRKIILSFWICTPH